MNFIYVIHLMCWNYLIDLIDLITHSRNRNNRNNSGDGDDKGGRALTRAPPFVVAVNAVAAVVLFDQNLDQKIDLGWPGLAWAKTGLDRSSPGLGHCRAMAMASLQVTQKKKNVHQKEPPRFRAG